MDDPASTASGKLGEYAYSAQSDDRSVADLVRDIIANVQEMVRSEVKLAKTEFHEEATKTLSAAKKMSIAAGAALFAVTFVLWSIALLLARVVPDWVATLLVGVLLGAIAAVLYANARGEIQIPKADKTIENIRENVEWMKHQTKS